MMQYNVQLQHSALHKYYYFYGHSWCTAGVIFSLNNQDCYASYTQYSSPVVFFNESRNSLGLRGHVSGESAQIVELSLQTIRRGLSFDKFLQSFLCGKQITNHRLTLHAICISPLLLSLAYH